MSKEGPFVPVPKGLIDKKNEQKWDAQRNLNNFFSEQIVYWGESSIETIDSLGRAWRKITALWVFAAGGYITGIAGIVLAVTR